MYVSFGKTDKVLLSFPLYSSARGFIQEGLDELNIKIRLRSSNWGPCTVPGSSLHNPIKILRRAPLVGHFGHQNGVCNVWRWLYFRL